MEELIEKEETDVCSICDGEGIVGVFARDMDSKEYICVDSRPCICQMREEVEE